jgi:hypothetical protein
MAKLMDARKEFNEKGSSELFVINLEEAGE